MSNDSSVRDSSPHPYAGSSHSSNSHRKVKVVARNHIDSTDHRQRWSPEPNDDDDDDELMKKRGIKKQLDTIRIEHEQQLLQQKIDDTRAAVYVLYSK